ncbi:hypothetical protein A0H81_09790 [Grifola frondosa]|uniref:Membrane anchor Opy2 N-terminal domain-containing protein n=1 Tax=Grifola frondosa TaxID=5627 RepID=A0A1C7M057_GRIFR|nr:hypothetical protein A0H81_09790 [Grifola frondosa]
MMLSESRLLSRQNQTGSDGCLICSDATPACSCPSSQCVIINRDCNTCSYAKCIANADTASSSSGGTSKGAVAGAVIACVLVLGGIIAFILYRRRLRQRHTAMNGETKTDVPARAEDVLNRPDPNEKPEPVANNVRVYPVQCYTDRPRASGSVGSASSAASTSAQSHGAATMPTQATMGSSGPARPPRSDELILNDRVNVSSDSLQRGYADSQRSGLTAPNRMSYMSTGSYASDFLNEAPVIVTPTRGIVKQVVGVVKAEVVRADGLLRANTTSRPARSPLAASSFGPSDVMHETEEEQEVIMRGNPFGDENSPYPSSSLQKSPTPSATTFGSPLPSSGSAYTGPDPEWLQQDPRFLYGDTSSNGSRPSSLHTQASAIMADIGSAKRVHLGLDQLGAGVPHTPLSASLSTPRSPYRMTSAKLITPPSGALEQQQARALQDLDPSARMSMSSVISSTSTRADSILESFPFVPPSPISNRPIRTPPRSPLAQQSFAQGYAHQDEAHDLPAPPDRKMLGMSIASQASTLSNGLGSFPFQIDSGSGAEPAVPPSAYGNGNGITTRKRASLDTLALTSDLSSYPLGFDKAPPMPSPRR